MSTEAVHCPNCQSVVFAVRTEAPLVGTGGDFIPISDVLIEEPRVPICSLARDLLQMPGVRVHHPTLRGVALLVPHPGDPKSGRKPKDYWIRLDGNGCCIVSERVWERLKQAEPSTRHGLTAVNEVKRPPRLVVGGKPENRRIVKLVEQAIRDIAPGVTKATVSRRNRHG